MTTRILLVGAGAELREKFRSTLERNSSLRVVAETSTGEAAVQLVDICLPDIVVMDIDSLGMSGMEVTRLIKSRFPDTHVIALSVLANLRMVRGMLHAGALGYVTKDCVCEEIIDAVRSVRHGGQYLGRNVLGTLGDRWTDSPQDAAIRLNFNKLTIREREVLRLYARDDLYVKEVAARLNLSSNTVRTHLRRVMKKINVHSKAELAELVDWLLPSKTEAVPTRERRR